MANSPRDIFTMELTNTRKSEGASHNVLSQNHSPESMLSKASVPSHTSNASGRSPVSTQFDESMDGHIFALSYALQSSDLSLEELLQEVPWYDGDAIPSFNDGMASPLFLGTSCNKRERGRSSAWNDLDTHTARGQLGSINDAYDDVDGSTQFDQKDMDQVDGMTPPGQMVDIEAMVDNDNWQLESKPQDILPPQEVDLRRANGPPPSGYIPHHDNNIDASQLNNGSFDAKALSTQYPTLTNTVSELDNTSGLEVDFKPKARRNLIPLDLKRNNWVDGSCVEIELYSENESDFENEWFTKDFGNASRMQTTFGSFISSKLAQRRGEGVGSAAPTMELQTPDFHRPNLLQLFRDYGWILETDTSAFVRTIFRAVKLNQLGVVKMLCQIAERRGYKLDSRVLRESESSATVLHVALLNGHEETAFYLMEVGGSELIKAPYTHADYKNKTALHVAVAKGNVMLLKRLLTLLTVKEKKALLNSVATGAYFDKQHPDGQLCTTAAAWAGHSHLLETLVKHGANLAVRNAHGDTLLHRIVIMSVERREVVDYKAAIHHVHQALKVWVEHGFKSDINAHSQDQVAHLKQQKLNKTFTKLMDIQNNDGLTPMALAAMLASPILVDMMNLEDVYKIPQTRLGSIAWLSYDVTDVASYTWNYYNKVSVLHILSHLSGMSSWRKNREDVTVHVLETEPLRSLLELKWSVYRLVYILWCVYHIVYIVCFSYFTFGVDSFEGEYTRPENHAFMYITDGMDSRVNRLAGGKTQPGSLNSSSAVLTNGSSIFDQEAPPEQQVSYNLVVLIVTPVAYLVTELIDVFGNRPYAISYMSHQNLFSKLLKRVRADTTILGNGPYRLVLTAHSIMALVWFSYYVMKMAHQELMLSVCLLFGWIFILFFTRGCRYASRFSVMIQKMFFQDMLYFAVVWILIMIAFAFCLCTSFGGYITPLLFAKMLFRLLNAVIGIGVEVPIDNFQYPVYCYTVIIIYAVFTVILLLNMLIAMMNTSYEVIKESKALLWKQQQLSIMMMLERRLLWCKWLCNLSEQKIWYKESNGYIRAYLDITAADIAV